MRLQPASRRGYAGADRRDVAPEPPAGRLSRVTVVDGLLLIAAVAVGLGGGRLLAVSSRWDSRLGLVVWTLAVVATLLAGGLAISRWRLVGECPSGLVGVVWLHLGTAVVPTLAVAVRVSERGGRGGLPLAALAVLLWHVLAAARAPAVDTRLRPVLRYGAGLAVTLVLAGALVLVRDSAEHPAWVVGTGVAAAVLGGWLLVAGLRDPRPLLTRGGLTVLAVTASEAMVLLLPGPSGQRFLYVGLIQLVAGGLALRAAVPSVRAALSDLRRYDGAAARRLRQATTQVLAHQERAHDLRSYLLAIDGGVHALAIDVPEQQRAELARVVTANLSQAHSLLGVERARCRAEPYRVLDAVRPAVQIERAAGRTVDCRVPADLVAFGHAGSLAQIVRNLLDNCAVHAPGVPVEVTARRTSGGRVLVAVADRGPGVPGECAELLFERGWRGGLAAGSGLGLHSCRRLAVAEGGEITARPRAGGGLRVTVSLPAVGAVPAPRAAASLNGSGTA